MSTYKPGTIFRIYIQDNHYTSILLRDGRVLEVKNPNTNKKLLYDSRFEWCAHHNFKDEDIVADESVTFPKPTYTIDKNGFFVPLRKNHSAFRWVSWCYQIVSEADPALFQNDDFKDAYNLLVEISDKYKKELYHKASFEQKNWNRLIKYYGPTNYDKWGSYPGKFACEYLYNNHRRTYTNAVYDKVREDILQAYKQIHQIIYPTISKYIKKHDLIDSIERDIKREERYYKKYERKARQFQEWAEQSSKEIEILKTKRNKLLADF